MRAASGSISRAGTCVVRACGAWPRNRRRTGGAGSELDAFVLRHRSVPAQARSLLPYPGCCQVENFHDGDRGRVDGDRVPLESSLHHVGDGKAGDALDLLQSFGGGAEVFLASSSRSKAYFVSKTDWRISLIWASCSGGVRRQETLPPVLESWSRGPRSSRRIVHRRREGLLGVVVLGVFQARGKEEMLDDGPCGSGATGW